MGKRYEKLSEEHIACIEHQKLFFVGTAADDGTSNVSPKGSDSLRVLSPNRIPCLNTTDGGNKTAAHLAKNAPMTIMFSAFDKDPKILRRYGEARAIHPRDVDWGEFNSLFAPRASAHQYVDFEFDLVQTSSGFGVPFFNCIKPRDNVKKWLVIKANGPIRDYWAAKNQISLDGLPTHIFADDSAQENQS
jgi:hypothetical protein